MNIFCTLASHVLHSVSHIVHHTSVALTQLESLISVVMFCH